MKEKKPMKKGVKIFMGTVVVVLVVALCFGCIGLYLKHEQSKPIFTPPEMEPQKSVTELPEAAADAAAYIDRLYEKMTTADDVEGDWHTDVQLGEIATPFAEADHALVQYFREQAPGKIASFYPRAAELVMSQTQDAPAFRIDPARVLEYAAHQGEVTEENDDSMHYYLDFTMTPDDVDMEAVQAGEVYQRIVETLSPAMTVAAVEITPTGETVNCRVDRLSDDLQSVKVTKSYQIKATVQLGTDYAALLEGGKAEVEFTYTTAEYINFNHYRLRFYQKQLVAKPDDIKALPLDVMVHSTATKEDYTLTYETSDPDAISIDETGVMTVHAAREEAITITATLDYDGHTYSDTLTLYITELEVKRDV